MVLKMHARRACDFVSLAKVSNASDYRNAGCEPVRPKDAPFTIDPKYLSNNGADGAKRADFTMTPGSFLHAVRTLMTTYALVSAAGEVNREWRTLDAALGHLTTVESMSRLTSRPNHALHARILESEISIRMEWVKMRQTQPDLSLGDIITLVAQRHAVWPLQSEFRPHNTRNAEVEQRKKKGVLSVIRGGVTRD